MDRLRGIQEGIDKANTTSVNAVAQCPNMTKQQLEQIFPSSAPYPGGLYLKAPQRDEAIDALLKEQGAPEREKILNDYLQYKPANY